MLTLPLRLPLCFYLKLFGHEMTYWEKALQYTVLTVSLILSIVGTVWAFLPREMIMK